MEDKNIKVRMIAFASMIALVAVMITVTQCANNALFENKGFADDPELSATDNACASNASQEYGLSASTSDTRSLNETQLETNQADTEPDISQPFPTDPVVTSSPQPEPQRGDQPSTEPGNQNPTEPSRTWVIDYEQVWVEDSPAWIEQIPVYGSEERSICNVCGANITGSEAAHAKAHMLAGEGSGHHNEFIQVVIGYNAIAHDATGHWETVEAGGHWE